LVGNVPRADRLLPAGCHVLAWGLRLNATAGREGHVLRPSSRTQCGDTHRDHRSGLWQWEGKGWTEMSARDLISDSNDLEGFH